MLGEAKETLGRLAHEKGELERHQQARRRVRGQGAEQALAKAEAAVKIDRAAAARPADGRRRSARAAQEPRRTTR